MYEVNDEISQHKPTEEMILLEMIHKEDVSSPIW